MRAVIGFLTDFGLRDHYVGAVKAAILTVNPEATIVDITHDLAPQDIEAGSFALAAALGAFPAGSVFLAVVDPGVGTSRRGLALESGPHRFVGPDNGLLTPVLEGARVHALTNSGLFRHRVSATFHARDIFGPVAGHLSRGTPLAEVGPEIADPVRLAEPPLSHPREGEWRGVVRYVDRYGNLITNVGPGDLRDLLGRAGGDPTGLVVEIEGTVLPLVETYAELPEGQPCALVGSTGRLEIAVNGGSAQGYFGASVGSPVGIRLLGPVL